MSRILRALLQASLFVLPWPARRRLLCLFFRFELDPDSRIGLSILDVRFVRTCKASRIGHFNLAHGLDKLELGEEAIIGKFNWISGLPSEETRFFSDQPERKSVLILGAHSALTNRHLVDCSDTVMLGEYCTFAGDGSQILTHSVDLEESRQRCAPVQIGRYSFVGTRSVILKGACLPDYCVVAAGSVYSAKSGAPYGLYAGVPATRTRELPKDYEYFCRPRGVIT